MNQLSFPATRHEALRRLKSFQPSMGPSYAKGRNYDLGPGQRSNVSLLSPYISSRLILEEEVVRTALSRDSAEQSEKFVEEVFWRAYWKGWLELRPWIWEEYQSSLSEKIAWLYSHPPTHSVYASACEGTTDFSCFNSWVQELKTTGYLHNHARMWFASIWIFYLGLPWELGADFFYKHLLDGDPASNTLGWRWVAGLQTRGKQYIASPENIAKFTKDRFDMGALKCAKIKPFIASSAREKPPNEYQPALLESSGLIAPSLLLIFGEDHYLEGSPLKGMNVQSILGLSPKLLEPSLGLAANPLQFKLSALKDGLERAGQYFGLSTESVAKLDSLKSNLHEIRRKNLTVSFLRPRVGPWRSLLENIFRDVGFQQGDLRIFERRWDAELYPLAQRGFFQFKRCIPSVIENLNLH